MPRHRVLVSAHRCGYAELGTVGGHEDPLAGIAHSAKVGADFCEFDVRRCADGTFVIAHDADGGTGDESCLISGLGWPELRDRAPGVCTLDELLAALESSGLGAHVDIKFRTPADAWKAGARWEAEVIAAVTSRLDPSTVVVTLSPLRMMSRSAWVSIGRSRSRRASMRGIIAATWSLMSWAMRGSSDSVTVRMPSASLLTVRVMRS